MGVFKNMEVVLFLCFGLVCAVAWWQPKTEAVAAPEARAEAVTIPVVVVSAKRMTAAEKRELDARQ